MLAIISDCRNPAHAGLLKIGGYYRSSYLVLCLLRWISKSWVKALGHNNITAIRGYNTCKSYGHDRPQIMPPHHLNREFVVNIPATLRSGVSQVTDIPISVLGKVGYIYL